MSRTHHARKPYIRVNWRRVYPRLSKPRERAELSRPADMTDLVDPELVAWEYYEWVMFELEREEWLEVRYVPRLRVAMGDVMKFV